MKLSDDYNWDSYTRDEYEYQLFTKIGRSDGQDLLVTDIERDQHGKLVFKDKLHPNWMKLYHTVDLLKVRSAFECGCGSAQHLINLRILNPNMALRGCDYSKSQIDLGFKYFNLERYDFAHLLEVRDLTVDIPADHPRFQFVYTQAVTMHLAEPRAVKFLQNMGSISEEYIFLIENLRAHDYTALLKKAVPEFEMVAMDSKYSQVHAILLKRITD